MARKKSPKLNSKLCLFLSTCLIHRQRKKATANKLLLLSMMPRNYHHLSSTSLRLSVNCLHFLFTIHHLFSSFSLPVFQINRSNRGRKTLHMACTGNKTARTALPSFRSTQNEAWMHTCVGLTAKFKPSKRTEKVNKFYFQSMTKVNHESILGKKEELFVAQALFIVISYRACVYAPSPSHLPPLPPREKKHVNLRHKFVIYVEKKGTHIQARDEDKRLLAIATSFVFIFCYYRDHNTVSNESREGQLWGIKKLF
jgi:hypothetical protein